MSLIVVIQNSLVVKAVSSTQALVLKLSSEYMIYDYTVFVRQKRNIMAIIIELKLV